jgi:hypothetical protein
VPLKFQIKICLFPHKQHHFFRFNLGGATDLWWRMSVVSIFILVARAAAQDASSNVGTNQIISTNLAPTEGIVTTSPPPAGADQLTAENSLTNQFSAMSNQPPPLGPANLGSTPPASPIMGSSAISGAPVPFAPVPLGPGISLWGPFDIHPRLLYTFEYGNGIEAEPGQPSETAINIISPGFLLDMGRHWSIDYTPTFSFYSSSAFKDTTGEAVSLRGTWSTENWVYTLSQGYVSTTEPLIETGAQTAQESYQTAINATVQMGSRLSLQLGVNQNFRDAQALTDLHEWTTQDWLNYQEGSKLSLGIGLTLGYDELDVGSSMPFEEVQGRITYHPGNKLTLTVSGGAEDRQFIDPSAPPLISPVFTVALQYVNQLTTITLNANRTVTPSFFANEVEVTTSVSGSIQEQLSKKISIGADASYSTIPLTSIEPGPQPEFFIGAAPRTTLQEVQNQTVTSYRVDLSYAVVERANLSVFYTVRDSSSGQAAFSYWSHQVGLSLSYQY